MDRPHTISIDELKDRLLAQLDAVVHHFAPPAPGSYTKAGLYWTLNPGRADRNVGSFCIHMSGPRAGQWVDYAMGGGRDAHGDVIDLIGMSLGIDQPAARIKAAREWLGLDTEDPATRRQREAQAAKLRAEREAKAAAEAEGRAKRQKVAAAVWLSGQAQILDTPVDHYLRGRGISLSALPHLPGAIRFHAECRYYFQEDLVDDQTGEVTTRTRWRPVPAMLTAIARGPRIIDCHRTYLDRRPDGSWGKLAVDDAKKVFGDYTGGCARLCGPLGPRGGIQKLRQAQPGAHVLVAEGIENALSAIALRALTGRPPIYVVAACMGANLGRVDLPEAVTEVTLAADNDAHPTGREALQRAIEAHRRAGRLVRVWRSPVPGEDLNDALRRALKEQEERGAA